MNAKPLIASVTLACLMCLACEDGVTWQSGLRAYMRVTSDDAQYMKGGFPVDVERVAQMPAADAGAQDAGSTDSGLPSVSSVLSPNNTVQQGQANKTVTAYVSPEARTVGLWLQGDRGYWVVPVGVPSVEYAPNLETKVELEFDIQVPLGSRNLWFAAADKHGRYGAPEALALKFEPAIPDAELVVSLTWTNNMDLDLIVVQPDGSMVTATGTLDPSGFQVPIKHDKDSGLPLQPVIDVDSNQNCVVDNVRMENAVYSAATQLQEGRYSVYVRLTQTCDVPQSNWTVRVLRGGKQQHAAYGASYAWQVDLPNGGPTGPGQFALQFDLGN